MNLTPDQISAIIIGIVTIAGVICGNFWVSLIGIIAVCCLLKGCA